MDCLQSLKKMTERIRKFQILNTQLFSMLSSYLQKEDEATTSLQNVCCYTPPMHPSVATSV